MKRWWLLIKGWYRYQVGHCPCCAATWQDAHGCWVCKDFRYACANGGPDFATRRVWWRRFKDLLRVRSEEEIEQRALANHPEVVAAVNGLIDLNAELQGIERGLRDTLPSPSPSPSPSAFEEDALTLEEVEKILREGRASHE